MALLCSTSSACGSFRSHSFHTKTTTFFFFGAEPFRSTHNHRHGIIPFAAVASKPTRSRRARDAPLVIVRLPPEPVERGKYSYEVESLIDQLSRLPPRGSIKKCLDPLKNKISVADFAIVYRELARIGDWQRSLRLFKYTLRHAWCKPDEHIHAIVIGVLGRHNLLLKAHDVFFEMPANSIPRTALSYTSLINAYARNGDHDMARKLLEQMKNERIPPTVLTYNIVINACARANLSWDVLVGLFAEMRHDGVHPDIVTYNTLLAAAGARGLSDEAEMILSTMFDSGVLPDLTTHKYLVDTFNALGRVERVAELLDDMARKGHLPDASAYNVLIQTFANQDRPQEALAVLRQMQNAGCVPIASTYSLILDLYGKKGWYDDVRDLFLEMKVGTTAPDVETYNIMLDAFGQGGYFKEVVTLFRDLLDEKVDPTMETYEALLFACGKGGLYHEAKHVMVRMNNEGVVPSTKAFNGFIEACGHMAFYEEALVAYNTMKEKGSVPDLETYNSLTYTYSRGGLFKEAKFVTQRMNHAWIERNTDSFTALIESYCQGGQYDDAVKVYVEMQKSKCRPNKRSLEAVLSAYCMAELVDESREQFEEIGKSIGGSPSIMAHCMMLSLYAKQNRWREASELLEEMKSNKVSNTHSVIACMIKGEYDTGTNWQMVEYVFENIILEGFDFGMRFYNALLDALWWLNQKERASRVLNEAAKRGLYPELFRKSKLVWSVDVHRMSVGGALTAVSVWLNDMQHLTKTNNYPPQLASIVVARGVIEKDSTAKVLPLPKAMFTFLKENISAAIHFAGWNKGRIVIQRAQLRKFRAATLASDRESSDESSDERLDEGPDYSTRVVIPLTNAPFPHTNARVSEKLSVTKEAELREEMFV